MIDLQVLYFCLKLFFWVVLGAVGLTAIIYLIVWLAERGCYEEIE